MNRCLIVIVLMISLIISCASVSTSHSAKKDNPFGVLVFLPWNDDWNHNMYPPQKALRAMDLIQEAGIGWVRMDFSRTKIQPEGEGEYDFADFDFLVKELDARGIRILGILGYSPPWAASDGTSWNSPPKDIESFKRYVFEVVSRYQKEITHWEIWNEPNLSNYWQPQDDLAGYSQLLEASYHAAKKANPGCKILNGGLAINSIEDYEHFYAKGLNRFFDIFNVHLFVGATGIADIDQQILNNADIIRVVMARHHDESKPLWITEIGFHGVPDAIRATDPKLKYKPGERQQAGLLTKTFKAPLESGKVDKIFWAFLQDTDGHFPDGADYLGLIRSDFSIKPSYEALKELIADYKK